MNFRFLLNGDDVRLQIQSIVKKCYVDFFLKLSNFIEKYVFVEIINIRVECLSYDFESYDVGKKHQNSTKTTSLRIR